MGMETAIGLTIPSLPLLRGCSTAIKRPVGDGIENPSQMRISDCPSFGGFGDPVGSYQNEMILERV